MTQTLPAFTAALEAVVAAGVRLVEFDVGLMLAEQKLNAPDSFTYTYEMPRELGRRATGPEAPKLPPAPALRA